MQKISKIIYLQSIFFLSSLLFIGFLLSPSITGNSILIDEDVDQFASPFDIYSNSSIITLEYQQVDNSTFHIQADMAMSESYFYHNVYYYTFDGWKKISVSTNNWIKNSFQMSIEDFYAAIPQQEGDDFFLGVWACKNIGDNWSCGCTQSGDCGRWFVQGIDLAVEGTTLEDCVDIDGDGYGVSGELSCFFNETDCDDSDPAVNPGLEEIVYNQKDDDCNVSTLDDDLDLDGATISTDCNDSNPQINPLAIEICEDSIDQNCDGQDKVCEQCGEGAVITTGCVCADESRYTGFCCDNNYQNSPCGTPEVIFYDGFESGTGNTWEYLNPYSRVNRDLPHSGLFSLNFIYASGTLQSNQYAETSLVPYDKLYYRYYIYFEEDYIHGFKGVELNTFGSSSWPIIQKDTLWQGDSTEGKLTLFINGLEKETDQIFKNGEWYCVEEEIITSDGDDSLNLWVDNVLLLSESGLDFSQGDKISYLKQGGPYEDSLLDTVHVYVDDIVISRERVGC